MSVKWQRKLGVAGATLLCSTVALAQQPGQDQNGAQATGQVFTATLNPMNNSGVSGQAWVVVGGDGQAVAVVTARGLEDGQTYPQHIHAGASNGNGCPTVQHDADNNFLITAEEAEAAIGAPAVPLEPFPQAQGGSYVYVQTLGGQPQPTSAPEQQQAQAQEQDASSPDDQQNQDPQQENQESQQNQQQLQADPEQLQQLEGRALAVHGVSVAGSFQQETPAACGVLQPIQSNGNIGNTNS